jgi:two-component system, OmpR family, sensor histidine kinase KdpD
MAEKPTVEGNAARSEAFSHEGPGESPRPKGKLKVFLSYAPGAGKTLAMLEDAYRRLQEGTDVVAGYVDARGEMLAVQLLEKFQVLPQHVVSSSGISYRGMDLDQVLARRPKLVLVDHMARSNPPGLRHIARYLEVDELLNAGIDVYTTLNVYQLESQADAVAYLTGVLVRDTVPDRFLDEAEQLEMVDMPPQELLSRYQAGRISVPPRVQVQMEKFFQPGNLFALRELTFRYVAQRSNAFMRSYLANRGLPGSQVASTRLLVCISGSPESSRLVRAGRRMADETRADWVVVHVETPDRADRYQDGNSTVAQHLRLAELLGAKTETLSGRTVVEAVRDYARKNHVHRVIVGRSARGRWRSLMGPTMAEQLLREDPTMSVYVVGSDYTPHPFQVPHFWTWFSRLQLLGSIALAVLPTVMGKLLFPTVISRSSNLVMLYLLSVVIASVFLGLAPALLTALLSVLAYDFFFVPPYYQLLGFQPEYAITFISLLVISFIVSTLVARERSQTRSSQRRAEQVTQLYELSRDLASAVDMPDILKTIIQHVQATFDREAIILLSENDELVLSASSAGKSLDRSELTAAEWAFQQGRPAGYNTGTFSYASFRYFPLETSRGIIGVLGVRLSGDKPELHPEQMRQLSAYVTKSASAIERALFAEEAGQTEVLRATEKLQTALLNSISHDLRTPLASITGVLSSLRDEDNFIDAEVRRELVETALGEAERLNRLVGNLLDMTRLESGTLRISLQPCDVQDVIGSALNATSGRLEGHPVTVDIPPDLPLVAIDYVLINQVLINLLDNAAKYSPENGPINIHAWKNGEAMEVDIEDRGPGIPPEDLKRIFEKFYRVKRFEHVVGTGLGLSICKGIIEVHGGKIWAENRPDGGGKLAFTVPLNSTRLTEQEGQSEPLREEVQP